MNKPNQNLWAYFLWSVTPLYILTQVRFYGFILPLWITTLKWGERLSFLYFCFEYILLYRIGFFLKTELLCRVNNMLKSTDKKIKAIYTTTSQMELIKFCCLFLCVTKVVAFFNLEHTIHTFGKHAFFHLTIN